MIKAVSLLVARETQTWIEALYRAGAITFDPDGTVHLNSKVRDLITLIHDELSGGDPAKKAELEQAFNDAITATGKLGGDMGAGTLTV